MKNIINYFNERSFIVNLISIAICVIGLFSMLTLKKDLIPPMSFKIVTIQTSLPGANAESIEKLITYPLEQVLGSIAYTKKITSNSSNNSSNITMFFEQRADIDATVSEINSRLQSVKSKLPSDVKDFVVKQMKVVDTNVVAYSIDGFDAKNTMHREWFKKFSDDMNQLDGVVRITSSLPTLQLEIELKADKLKQYEISIDEIQQIITQNLRFMPVANKVHDNKNISITVETNPENIEDFNNITIKVDRFAHSLKLSDVAKVSIVEVKRDFVELTNHKEMLTFTIYKDTKSDIINLSEKFHKFLKEYENPYQFKFIEQYDASSIIKKQLDLLVSNGIAGIALVALLLWAILGFRIAMVALMGVPISYFGTAILLQYFDISFDLVSFIAMILISGVLVDDAVVMSEKYADLLGQGYSRKEASAAAALAMMPAITSGALTTIIAFAPIMFIQSDWTTAMKAIPIVILATLAIGWFECFFLMPNHLQHFVGQLPKKRTEIFDKFSGLYEFILRKVIKLRYISFAVIIGLFAVAIMSFQDMKTKFNIQIDVPYVAVNYELKHANSLKENQVQVEELYQALDKLIGKETTYIETQLGRSWVDQKSKRGYQYGMFYLMIEQTEENPDAYAKMIQDKIKEKIAEFAKQEKFKSINIEKKDQSKDFKDNELRLYVKGDDKKSLSEVHQVILSEMAKVKEFNKILDEDFETQIVWKFDINLEQLKLYQLNSASVTNQIRNYISHVLVGETRMNGENFEVVTILDVAQDDDFKPEVLQNIKILAGNGALISLDTVGKWRQVEMPLSIKHEQQRRIVSYPILFDKDKITKEQADEKLKTIAKNLEKLFPSYQFKTQTISEDSEETKKWAIQIGFTVLVGILVVLAMTLKSIGQTLVVGFAMFGVLGVFVAFKLHGVHEISIMAIFGFLGVAGVAVNDSLLMVDTINEIRNNSQKSDYMEAVIKGCRSRFRSIFITSVTALAGVFPTAYSLFGESGFTQPMTFAMAWGLLSCAMLILFGIPVLFSLKHDISSLIGFCWRWVKGKIFRRTIQV